MLKNNTNYKILKLTLSKQPFDIMFSGEKKIEYRKPSKWMISRLFDKEGNLRDYQYVQFVNGYGKFDPYFITEFKYVEIAKENDNISFSNGLEVNIEKGDYLIHLGDIVETFKDESFLKQMIDDKNEMNQINMLNKMDH